MSLLWLEAAAAGPRHRCVEGLEAAVVCGLGRGKANNGGHWVTRTHLAHYLYRELELLVVPVKAFHNVHRADLDSGVVGVQLKGGGRRAEG